MGKTWAIVFILLGLALLLAAVTFWADTLTMEEPPSLGQTVRDWLVTLAGLGSSLAGWLSLLKEKPKESKDSAGSAPTTVTDNAQAAIGPGSRAIQTAGDYYEGGTHIHLPPETPQAGDTIGYIPPYKTETYIHRGQIEDEVREFLRKGNGVGAILGLHAPGGLGKTELARRAAEDLKTEFEGVLWVDVGDKAAPQVVTEMLTRLGVQLPPGASYEQQKTALHARLRGHRYLILFDDVRQKALDGLQDFLPAKPCAALITSRIQQIGGVHKTFMLDRMTPEQARQLLEAILGPETVAAEAEAAAHLAARCAFNPLALEIAARRIRQLQGFSRPIARYFEMVRDRFPELKMDGDARWDLELVFDISYLDLNEADRARFRALAVFHPSGFAPEAAAHIWGVETSAARQVLSRFINLSLVKPVAGDFERYRLHDLLDEYAALKLERAGEAETLNARLAEWLENLFEQHSMDDPSTAPEAALEIENLRRALAWAGRQKDGNRLAGLIRAARNWFVVLNLYAEWGAAAEKALSLGISEKQTKANVLKAIGDVQQFRKQLDEALKSYGQALALFREIGDRLGEANVLQAIGDVQQFRDERDEALKSYGQALALFREIGAKLGEANVLKAIGDVQQFRKQLDEALKSYGQALALFREIGDRLGEANVLAAFSRLSLYSGDMTLAEEQLEQAIAMRQAMGDLYSEGADYGNFALVLLRLGHKAKAKEYAQKARKAFEQIREPALLKWIEDLLAACEE